MTTAIGLLVAFLFKPIQEDVLKPLGREFYCKIGVLPVDDCKTPGDAEKKIKKYVGVWEKLFYGRNANPDD